MLWEERERETISDLAEGRLVRLTSDEKPRRVQRAKKACETFAIT